MTYFPDEPPWVDPVIAYPSHYHLDLFYIAPYYHRCSNHVARKNVLQGFSHRIFPDLEKIIVVDIDLEFRCDS